MNWFALIAQWPLLLTWIYLHPSMNKYYIHYNVWDEITYTFLKFNGETVEI